MFWTAAWKVKDNQPAFGFNVVIYVEKTHWFTACLVFVCSYLWGHARAILFFLLLLLLLLLQLLLFVDFFYWFFCFFLVPPSIACLLLLKWIWSEWSWKWRYDYLINIYNLSLSLSLSLGEIEFTGLTARVFELCPLIWILALIRPTQHLQTPPWGVQRIPTGH